MSILNDFATGTDGEQLVAAELQKLGYECAKKDGKFSDFDLYIIEPYCTFEIKNDVYSFRSNNIAIEYWNCKSDKPSGLTATKADFWCHIIKGVLYIIKTEDLRAYVAANPPLRTIKRGGDKNANMYLYKIDDIIGIFSNVGKLQEFITEISTKTPT